MNSKIFRPKLDFILKDRNLFTYTSHFNLKKKKTNYISAISTQGEKSAFFYLEMRSKIN